MRVVTEHKWQSLKSDVDLGSAYRQVLERTGQCLPSPHVALLTQNKIVAMRIRR